MKKMFLLLLLSLVFSACTEKSLVNEPETTGSNVSLLKLPQSSGQMAKTLVFTKSIDGALGGVIYINSSYVSIEGKNVQISGSLEVPAGAYQGVKNIYITLDDEEAVINFSPSPTQFDVPLKLTLIYKGVNLQGIDKNKINFYYISDDGSRTELISSQSIIFNPYTNTLGIVKAVINHFSRFGWVI